MNICFFNAMAELGGGEHWILRVARLLAEKGHGVLVACTYRSALFHECQRLGLEVYAFYNVNGSPFYTPLVHALEKRRIDIIHATVIGAFCESSALSRVLMELNARRPEAPACLVLKTGLPPQAGLSAEYYGFGAGSVVRRLHVVSAENKERFIEWQSPSRRHGEFVEVMPEGVDLGRFDPASRDRAAARERWQIPSGAWVVVCLARLHPQKGQDNLLLAAREVLKKRPECLFLFAGDGEDRGRLERLANHLGLQKVVRFLGPVDDVPDLLAASDVLCQPSLTEGLPNAVMEAMAMALPIVATNVGGLPDAVEDGRSGILVRPHDIRALSKSLAELMPECARELGRGARARVVREFDFEVCTHKLLVSLESELNEFRRQPRRVKAPSPRPASPRIRVLFLMSLLRQGGEETEVAILARHLDRGRFETSVLSAWPASEAAPVREKLARLGTPLDEGCHRLPTLPEKLGYLLKKVQRDQIQLVVACQDTLLAYHLFYHLDPRRCRLVEHAGVGGEVCRIPKDYTARHISVSRAIQREAAQWMPPGHALFVPSMVDLTEFESLDRTRLRQEYGFEDDVVVTFVGRIDRKKGLASLVEAAEIVLQKFPEAKFLVVGGADCYDPVHEQELHVQAEPLRASGRFIFLGARSDVPALLTASDIFVLPAVGEGMSHAIQEAGAARLPVVAVDDGAAREQLDDGAAGLLIRPRDSKLLATALERLLGDAGLRQRLGQALHERVVSHYSAAHVIPEWEALLSELAAEVMPSGHQETIREVSDDSYLPFPAEIQIETNTACNAKCIMCPYPEVSRELPPGKMDQELYENILRQCAQEKVLWRIEPFLNNEPFTDKRMVDWIALSKRLVPHAMVTVTTNGSLLGPEVTNRLVQSGLDAIWFSFNGATRETYEQIMGLSYDRVKRNIDYLLEVKPAKLQVFVNMIETQTMRGEIADNIRYWQSRGVTAGSSPLVNRAGNVRNFDALNYQPVNNKPVRICDLLFHKMYIGYNGDVLLCCMDWRRRIVLGNARHQSLREIWQGPAYQRYRRLHEEGRSVELELCADCTYVYT
jgi:radical SAM protein with 4Fe4S-binding SPASM domain